MTSACPPVPLPCLPSYSSRPNLISAPPLPAYLLISLHGSHLANPNPVSLNLILLLVHIHIWGPLVGQSPHHCWMVTFGLFKLFYFEMIVGSGAAIGNNTKRSLVHFTQFSTKVTPCKRQYNIPTRMLTSIWSRYRTFLPQGYVLLLFYGQTHFLPTSTMSLMLENH